MTIRGVLAVVTCAMAMALGGCGMARVSDELLPGCQAMPPVPETSVEVYEEGISAPARGATPFVRLVANGNGYATKDILVEALRKRTAELGGEMIVIGQTQQTTGPAVTSYGNGMAITDTMKFPFLQATGFRWSQARIGLRWDNSLVVVDVVPGSPAAVAGARIGERLLAINGTRVTGDPMALHRACGALRPGESAQVEFARPDNTTHTITITPTENR